MGSCDALPLYLLIQNPSMQIPSLSPDPLTPSAALCLTAALPVVSIRKIGFGQGRHPLSSYATAHRGSHYLLLIFTLCSGDDSSFGVLELWPASEALRRH